MIPITAGPARYLLLLCFGVAICWALLSVFLIPSYMVAITHLPVTESPDSRGQPFEDITIRSNTVRLAGWWLPAPNPIAQLIFVHGAGSNRTSEFVGSLDFYRMLHDLGVSVVTMDLRNHGNSPITDATIRMGATEWPDVIAAADWLNQNHPSPLPRYVLGASMGGSTAIQALHHGLQADGLILLDPQLNIFDSLSRGAQVSTGLPAPIFSLAARVAIWQYRLPSGERKPLSVATTLSLPILLIQNWDDPVTRSAFASRLHVSNPNVRLKRVPQIDKTNPCLDNKGAWGTHVAALPCHPNWTRRTIRQFIESIFPPSIPRSSERPVST
jgi:pimeloyl-ACP methyl ester carboxylesterase